MPTVAVAFEVTPEQRQTVVAALDRLADPIFLKDEGFLDALPYAEVLMLRGWRREIGRGLISTMTSLRLLQSSFAGPDYLPWKELPPGVTVCHNAGAQVIAVAEHAFALLLAAAKRLRTHDAAIREARFPQDHLSAKIRGSTLGILGYGAIGREVARFGRAFGMRVVGLNRHGRGDDQLETILGPDAYLDLARQSDFLVCLLPHTKGTRGILDAAFFTAMKPDAAFVNVSRGRVVDERALYAHLRTHPKFTAALDVWWQYPREDGERPFTEPFHELPNVIMTPHVAFANPDHREVSLAHALMNVQRHLRGEPLRNVVSRADHV